MHKIPKMINPIVIDAQRSEAIFAVHKTEVTPKIRTTYAVAFSCLFSFLMITIFNFGCEFFIGES